MVERCPDTLCIHTLGRFRVMVGNRSILDSSEGMSKVWNVFKYLVTNRELRNPGEVVCEVFWPDSPWRKARHSLYNTVYRLRSVLDQHYPDASLLSIRDGMYTFNTDAPYWMDVEEFETLCHQAHKLGLAAGVQTAELLERALELYKGDYLAENFYDDWVKGAQQRYRTLYKRAVLQYADLLIAKGEYEVAKEVCETALEIEPLDEDIQVRLISAFVEDGNLREAKAHYERFSAMIYRESGILPSKRLRDLYQKIQVQSGAESTTDFEAIQELLDRDDDSKGTHLCDNKAFQELYHLERKRMVRNHTSAYLVKIDLTKQDFRVPSAADLDAAGKFLTVVLRRVLRSQDVVCRWNDSQFLVLLSDATHAGAGRAIQRISEEYQKDCPVPIIIRCRERLVVPETSPFVATREMS